MRAWRIVAPAAVLAAATYGYAADLPTAEELLAKVTKVIAEMKSFQADTRLVGDQTEDVGHLAIERSEKDGKRIEKYSSSIKMTLGAGSGKERTGTYQTVFDGTYVWSEARSPESKEVTVTKSAPPTQTGLGFADSWAESYRRIWKQARLKVVGEDAIEGRAMFVLEGTHEPDPKNPLMLGKKTKIWVGQNDFMVTRLEDTMELVMDGRHLTGTITSEYRNITVDQPIDPALFVYAPPEGAKIDDQTKPKP